MPATSLEGTCFSYGGNVANGDNTHCPTNAIGHPKPPRGDASATFRAVCDCGLTVTPCNQRRLTFDASIKAIVLKIAMPQSLRESIRTLVHRRGKVKDQQGSNRQEKGGHDRETVTVVPSATSPAGKDIAQVSAANINVARATPPPRPISSQQICAATTCSPPLPAAPSTHPAYLETSADADGTTASLPVRLWDRAYDDLKREETALVNSYERILSCQLQRGLDSIVPESQPNAIAQDDLDERRRQMTQLIHAGLDKTAGEAKAKEAVSVAVGVVLLAKDIISSAITAVPQAALAWTGVCVALEVSPCGKR